MINAAVNAYEIFKGFCSNFFSGWYSKHKSAVAPSADIVAEPTIDDDDKSTTGSCWTTTTTIGEDAIAPEVPSRELKPSRPLSKIEEEKTVVTPVTIRSDTSWIAKKSVAPSNQRRELIEELTALRNLDPECNLTFFQEIRGSYILAANLTGEDSLLTRCSGEKYFITEFL